MEEIKSANISWLIFKPVAAGYCELADLSNGKYTIRDLLDMHEAIDEQAEYERRAIAQAEAKAKRG